MRQKMRQFEAPSPCGGGDDGGIEPAHRAIDRQHHVGQQHVHHADQHAGEIVQQRQRVADDAGIDQPAIEHAVAAQQHHPGIGAHQDRGPQRQQHEDEAERRPGGRRGGDQEAQRIAQQQAEAGDQQGDLEGVPEHPQVKPLAQRLGVPVERARLDAEAQHAHDREEEEGEQEDEGGQRREDGSVHGWERATPVALMLMKDAPLEWRAPSLENMNRVRIDADLDAAGRPPAGVPRAGWRTISSSPSVQASRSLNEAPR